MTTKLTLSLNEDIIAKAKVFAKDHNTSVSKMVEDFLRTITVEKKKSYPENPVDKLAGIINDPGIDYDQMRYEALKEKYGL